MIFPIGRDVHTKNHKDTHTYISQHRDGHYILLEMRGTLQNTQSCVDLGGQVDRQFISKASTKSVKQTLPLS